MIEGMEVLGYLGWERCCWLIEAMREAVSRKRERDKVFLEFAACFGSVIEFYCLICLLFEITSHEECPLELEGNEVE